MAKNIDKIGLYIVLLNNVKTTAKDIKTSLGMGARKVRLIREEIEQDFISGKSELLIGADEQGYFAVDIHDDNKISKYISRRKKMAFSGLKLLYRLEKAIVIARTGYYQTTFYDFVEEFKLFFDKEGHGGE